MKTYELFLHCKQGDTLAQHIEFTKNPSDALKIWAYDFQNNREICEKLARDLLGKNINIFADANLILLQGTDASAREALDSLVKEGILVEADEEYEDISTWN